MQPSVSGRTAGIGAHLPVGDLLLELLAQRDVVEALRAAAGRTSQLFHCSYFTFTCFTNLCFTSAP